MYDTLKIAFPPSFLLDPPFFTAAVLSTLSDRIALELYVHLLRNPVAFLKRYDTFFVSDLIPFQPCLLPSLFP